jgi:hypothetical protein
VISLAKKKTFSSYYNELPKEIKVLPYVALSGALAEVIEYLGLTDVDNTIIMAVINLVVVFLVQVKGRVERLKK